VRNKLENCEHAGKLIENHLDCCFSRLGRLATLVQDQLGQAVEASISAPDRLNGLDPQRSHSKRVGSVLGVALQ
jgi:hypothetical protein